MELAYFGKVIHVIDASGSFRWMRTLHHALWTLNAAGSSCPEPKFVNEMGGLKENFVVLLAQLCKNVKHVTAIICTITSY
jgi:hypothetical protein